MPSKHVPAPLNLEVPTKGFEVDHIFPNRFSLTSPASDAASTHNFYIRSRPCSPEPAEGDNNVLNLNGHAFFSAATFPNPDPDVEPLVRLAERRRTLSIKTTATTRTFLRVRRRADTAPSAFNEDEEFTTPAPKGKDHSLVNFKRIAKNAGVITRFHKKKPSVAGVENLAPLKSPKSAKEKKEKDKAKDKIKEKEKEKEKAKEKEKRKSAKVKVKAEGQTTTPLRSVTKAFFRRRRPRKDSDATSPPPQVRRVQSFTAFLNAAGVDAPDDASDTDSIMEEANAITNTIHQEYDFVYEPEVDGSVYFVFGEAY